MDTLVPEKCKSCESLLVDGEVFSCVKHKETNYLVIPCLRSDSYVPPDDFVATPYKEAPKRRSKKSSKQSDT